jgi:UPF0755 protein
MRRTLPKLIGSGCSAACGSASAIAAWIFLGWTAAGACQGGDAGRDPAGFQRGARRGKAGEGPACWRRPKASASARACSAGQSRSGGEYEVPAGASPSQLLELLQSGRVLQRFVIVPEGLPSVMVHDRLMRAAFLTGEVPVPEEGSVLPDSYSYQRGESRAAVLKRMQDAMDRNGLGSGRRASRAARSPAEMRRSRWPRSWRKRRQAVRAADGGGRAVKPASHRA